MRTNSLIVAVAMLAAGAATNAKADLVLGAPGVPVGLMKASKLPAKVDYSLTVYKYVYRGLEAKSDTAGAPGSSGTNGNGGQFHLWGTVASPGIGKVKEGKIDFRDEEDFKTAPLKTITISPPEVFKANNTPITINIEWKGTANAKKPNGFFNILGEFQPNPFPPTGSLNFAVGTWMLAPAGSQNPDGVVNIVRD